MRSGASGVACLDASWPFLPCALASADCIPFHYCAFCERDAPETIDDQRRCTGCRYRTIYAGRAGAHPGADGMDRSYHFNGACHDLLTQLNSEIEDENEAKLGIWINLDSDHSIAHI